MNLQLLNWAEVYYQLNGFQMITAPWLVDEEISDMTKPAKRRNFMVLDKALVGSAEQGYLQLMVEDKLPQGRFVTTTPCFRDEEVLDRFHKRYFLKTELIDTGDVSEDSLKELVEMALKFYAQFVKVRVSETAEGFDIEETKTGMELGSYGIRRERLKGKLFEWVYGTGCAEPRLSIAIGLQKKLGYHKDKAIPKSSIGSPLKIFEEMMELQDAVLQSKKLLILCELADLQGAIKYYLKNYFPGMTMTDLTSMSRLTEKAFRVGLR